MRVGEQVHSKLLPRDELWRTDSPFAGLTPIPPEILRWTFNTHTRIPTICHVRRPMLNYMLTTVRRTMSEFTSPTLLCIVLTRIRVLGQSESASQSLLSSHRGSQGRVSKYGLHFSQLVMVLLVHSATLEALEAATRASDPEVVFDGTVTGSVEGVYVEVNSDDPSAHMVRLDIIFKSLTDKLDHAMRSQGNFLGNFSQRLYWVGSTSIRRYGEFLELSSIVRYEQWLRQLFIKTRIFKGNVTVVWRLFVEPDRLDKIRIRTQVTDIIGLKTNLGRLLESHVRKDISSIPLAIDCGACDCDHLADAVSPEPETLRFEAADDGAIRLIIMYSVASDLTRVLTCFGN